MIICHKYRVKSLTGFLNFQAKSVNFVWNYCNDIQRHALKWGKQWPTAFDLIKLTSGSSLHLGILAKTIEGVCQKYATSRGRCRKRFLRYRGQKSLGWVPISKSSLSILEGGFKFSGKLFRVFDSRQLPPDAKIKDGSCFSKDARGNWFLNIVIEIADLSCREITKGVGIDLGLKEFATLSTGEKINNPHHFRALEESLAKAQRARKKRQAANIHARISSARHDFHHKLSTRIIREFDYIAAGNIKAAGLAKTSLAKSINDAGWSSFRNMLRYKAIGRGAVYEEVSEYLTTQTCHECGSIAGPKGQTGLNERTWICTCGAVHDRDHNAAINILMRGSGHGTPVEGIAV